MTREGGFTVLELLVATAILLVVSASVLELLHEGVAASPVIEETTDLHQRARVAAEAVAADLRAAAAGTPTGPLSQYFAAVDPRRPSDPTGFAAADAVTVRYVPAGGGFGRLAQPLAPAGALAVVDTTGCPLNTVVCGFTTGVTAVLFDTAGTADFVNVDTIGPGALTISDLAGSRSVTHPAGTQVAEAVQATYFLDLAQRQLRRAEGGGTFVVADNVVGLTFEYFAADMTPLPLSRFTDGPFAGSGSTRFDVDLLQVRTMRATLRLETGVDRMRGVDPALFVRPGTASGRRTIPDLTVRVDVALRN